MTFNVSEFSSQINKRGLAVSNLFVMRITPPSKTFNSGISDEDLTFFCSAVQLPAKNIIIQEHKPLSYGPLESYPIGMAYDDIAATFYCDQDMNVLKFFERWQQLIYNYNASGGLDTAVNNQGVYELSYKEKYVGSIEVLMFGAHDKTTAYKFKYEKVFPTNVSTPALAWDNGAEPTVITVNFRFSKMSTSGVVAANSRALTAAERSMSVSNMTFGSLLDIDNLPPLLKDIQTTLSAVNQLGQQLKTIF